LPLARRLPFPAKDRVPDWVAVILLGIIEGVTEFLPVSSTGHLLLAEQWLPRQTDLFNTVIQSGAVLAVLLVFSRRAKELLLHWREAATRDYLAKLLVAFVITGASGLLAKKLGFQLPESALPVALATLLGGGVILLVERWLRGKPLGPQITWPVAVAVGLAQLAAGILPGTSRSGATILVGLAMGLNRPAATEFSFLLGIPTLLSAGGLEIYSSLKQDPDGDPVAWDLLLFGTVAAAVSAFVVVKWLLHFVQTHTFIAFGWYRIVLGLLILLMLK
jgi:undecaprenyl-diphosphatase